MSKFFYFLLQIIYFYTLIPIYFFKFIFVATKHF